MPRESGRNVFEVVIVRANTKSLHAKRKENSAAVMIEFLLIGTTIAQNARQWPAPSTLAASTSDDGIDCINAQRMRIANGIAELESASTRPGILLSKPSLTYTVYSELAITMPGIIWEISRASMTEPRNRSLNSASP